MRVGVCGSGTPATRLHTYSGVMAAWLPAAIDRLPPRARRIVVAATAVLLLAGAITSLTLEAAQGGGAHRRTPSQSRAFAPGAGSSAAGAGEPAAGVGHTAARRSRSSCAVPRLVSEVRLRPRERWSGESCHARAAQPADQRSALGSRRPSAAGARGSSRWPRSERRPRSSSRPPPSRTEGSRRIACGSRFRNTPAAGW